MERMGTNANNPDQFNIRWKNYTLVLQSVFRELLEDERLVDVTLACEGGSIKCHRIVLTACSSYFEKLLGEYPSTNHLVIFMKDLKQWELEALVHFMYNGEVSVKQNRLAPLVRAAESLRIRGLSSENDQESDPHQKLLEEDDPEDNGEEFHGGKHSSINHQQINRSQLAGGKSLLRGNPNSSTAPTLQQRNKAPLIQNRGKVMNQQQQQNPLKRTGLSNGPPKLVKMLKVDETADVKSQMTSKLVQQKKPQLLSKMDQHASSVKMEGAEGDEGEEEDGFPHEVELTEHDEEYEENGELEMNTHEEDEGEENISNSDEMEELAQAPPGRRVVYKYGKEIRDSALAALNTGMSLRQCSEAFGVPRKTLSKWRCREAAPEPEDTGDCLEGEEEGQVSGHVGNGGSSMPVVIRDPPMTGPVIDATDRANRLGKATDLALAGVTVRQAAAHYGIPRTTLCAYMKRRGLTGKRMFTPPSAANARKIIIANRNRAANSNANAVSNRNISAQISESNQVDGFPFLGLSDLVDEMHGGYDEEQDQEYEEDDNEQPDELSPKH